MEKFTKYQEIALKVKNEKTNKELKLKGRDNKESFKRNATKKIKRRKTCSQLS